MSVPIVDRRQRTRRSEANTPRSEMEPNRRKLHDRRSAPQDSVRRAATRAGERPLRDLTDEECVALTRVSGLPLASALAEPLAGLGDLAERELSEREYSAAIAPRSSAPQERVR
jgi:hypothetical protein